MSNLTMNHNHSSTIRFWSRIVKGTATRMLMPGLLSGALLAGSASAQIGRVAKDKRGNPLDMLVVCGNCPVFADAKGSRKNDDAAKLGQFSAFYLVGVDGFIGDGEEAGRFVQALNPNTMEPVGFFRMEDILLGQNEALRAYKNGKRQNVFRKALVVTNLQNLPKDMVEQILDGGEKVITFRTATGEVQQLSRVPVLQFPGASSMVETNVLSRLQLYEHFAVWKEKKVGPRNWLLLGTAFNTRTLEDAKTFMVGWIPEDRTYAWNTAQAVEYEWKNRKERLETPAGIFADEGSAFLAARDGLTKVIPKKIYSIEDNNPAIGNECWDKVMCRYPVLEAQDMEGQQLMKLGYIGGLYGKNGAIMTKQELEMANAQREKFLNSRLNLDVLILLDGTKSMERYRESTIRAVKEVISQVRAQAPEGFGVLSSDLLTRCAIAVYRNKNDPAKGKLARFSYQPFMQLGGNKDQTSVLVDFLEKLNFDSNERTEYREALIDGVVSAVDAARRDQGANPDAYKMMIVVGDSGDLSGEHTLNESVARLNGKTAADSWDFYAVSVAPQDMFSTRDDYKKFQSDLTSLAKDLKLPMAVTGENEVYDPASRFNVLGNGDFVATIQRAQSKGVACRNLVNKVIVNPRAYPTKLQDFAREIMAARNISEKLMEENQVQFFDVGWTTLDNKENYHQWREEVLVNKTALISYLNFLKPFTEYLGAGGNLRANVNLDAQTINEFAQAIKTTFQNQAGQFDTKRPLKEMMGDASEDLPIRSPLLAMKMDDLISHLTSRDARVSKERAKQLRHLGLCHNVLQCYVEGIDYVFQEEGGYLKDVKRTEAEKEYWLRRGTQFYCWIPTDLFP